MINNELFADVHFIVEGQRIHAHKSILVARSVHFAAMFSSGMRESFEKNVVIPVIRIPIFMALLEYLYTDTLEDSIEPVMAIEVYTAADVYQMDRLKNLCISIVEKDMVVENAALLLNTCHELHAEELFTLILTFITTNMGAVARSESYHTLSRSLLISISDAFHIKEEMK